MSEVVDIHKKSGKRKHFDVYIGRRIQYHDEFTEDSKWANRSPTLQAYEEAIRVTERLWDALDELDGKILGCWCVNTREVTPLKCHGQVLMKLLREKKADYQQWKVVFGDWKVKWEESHNHFGPHPLTGWLKKPYTELETERRNNDDSFVVQEVIGVQQR